VVSAGEGSAKTGASVTDQAVMERSVLLMRSAIRSVKKALPDTDPELIGGFFANLLDLWETGQTHWTMSYGSLSGCASRRIWKSYTRF
jgi:hypothetical protein